MATVKGDVHDIGKNIVGVVLQCNNYEVIDLGVMVPAQKILDTAREVGADIIGLSGLITPSLDEMVTLATRDAAPGPRDPAAHRRRDHLARAHRGQGRPALRRPGGLGQGRLPLGADRGRAAARRAAHDAAGRRQGRLRLAARAARRTRPTGPSCRYADARANAHADRLERLPAAGPRAAPASHVLEDYDLAELRDYIDWQPFFNAWEMKGRFPDILNNPATGEAARKLYDDAQEMLDRIVAERWLTARGVFGFFPAAGDGDDTIALRRRRAHRGAHPLHHLRQQGEHRDGVPNRSLADFVAPRETGLADHVGGFAVTAGIGLPGAGARPSRPPTTTTTRSCWSRWPTGWPRPSPSGCTSGCAPSSGATQPEEQLSNEDLIAERYDGIRPAPGYPACPDHTEKLTLWELLDVEASTGIALTESMAMWPGASVSGWYFCHPQSQYFVVGRLGRDQVDDYAERKGWTLAEAERWLSPNLGYDPED